MSRPVAELFREIDEARSREMKSMETNVVVTHVESTDSKESKAWSVTVNRVPVGVPIAGGLSLPAATDLPDDVRAALVEWLGLTGAAEHWRGLTAQHLAYAREHDGAAMPIDELLGLRKPAECPTDAEGTVRAMGIPLPVARVTVRPAPRGAVVEILDDGPSPLVHVASSVRVNGVDVGLIAEDGIDIATSAPGEPTTVTLKLLTRQVVMRGADVEPENEPSITVVTGPPSSVGR